jgi:hypothetical protein
VKIGHEWKMKILDKNAQLQHVQTSLQTSFPHMKLIEIMDRILDRMPYLKLRTDDLQTSFPHMKLIVILDIILECLI